MRREALIAAIAVGALGLVGLFWATAPTVRGPGGSSEASPDIAAAAPGGSREHGASDGADPESEGAEGAAEDELLDPQMQGRSRPMLEKRGGLKRMRTLLEQLEGIEQEPVPEGATPAEEDAILARPIARKAQLIDELTRDAAVIAAREDAARGARARLLLAQAHDHMAAWFREAPVPSYLPEQGQEEYLDALEERALTQEEKAASVRDAARESAAELPADHPLRERLK